MKYILVIIRTVFVFSFCLFVGTYYYKHQLIALENPISENSMKDPVFKPITDSYGINFEKGEYLYQVRPVSEYSISGVVLNKADYDLFNTKPDNGIAYDFCMAWGGNLKNGLYLSNKPAYTQYDRSCYYSFSSDPGFDAEDFANHRLIINSDKLLESIRQVNVGDEIKLVGRISNISATKKSDQSNVVLDWKTRNHSIDSEKNMSEVLYVDSVEVTNSAHYKESIINHYAYLAMIYSFGLLVLHLLGLMIFLRPQKYKEV